MVIYRIYWDNGKENGSYRGNRDNGKKMETTIMGYVEVHGLGGGSFGLAVLDFFWLRSCGVGVYSLIRELK